MTLDNLYTSFGICALLILLVFPFFIGKTKRLESIYFTVIFVTIIIHCAIYVAIKLNIGSIYAIQI